jgi:hypothetical protein
MRAAATLLMAAALAPALAETRVTEAGRGPHVAFDNGVTLRFEADGGRLIGLTHVAAEGVALRSPELAAHPVVRLQEAGPHSGCELTSVDQDGDAVVLRCRLLRDDGGPDELTWRVERRSETIDGERWVGLAWRYEVSAPDARVDLIRDIGSWEIGGEIEGAFVQPGPPAPMTGPWRSTPTWTMPRRKVPVVSTTARAW